MKYADLALGDRVRLRKPHPCGSYEWLVVRLGADIGLRCVGCGRRVLLPRSEVERRIKQIVSRGAGEANRTAETDGADGTGGAAATAGRADEHR
ncbi:MAG TPA: DUF951 domain-containing protein [Ktedonobacterales bacterium]|jgi:hypothetical protein